MNIYLYIFYILPLGLCLFGYTLRTIYNVQEDIKKKEKFVKLYPLDDFHPTELRMDILNRLLISIIPGLNFGCLLIDIFPEVFRTSYDKIINWLEQPIISSD